MTMAMWMVKGLRMMNYLFLSWKWDQMLSLLSEAYAV